MNPLASCSTGSGNVMIRDIDFNDGYIGLGNGHPSDTIAALLTPCELGDAAVAI
jgi:2-methylcitrate dehydratase PrpD